MTFRKLDESAIRSILMDRRAEAIVAAEFGVRPSMVNRIRVGARHASVAPEIPRWRRYRAPKTLGEAVEIRVDKSTPDGCWNWIAPLHNCGYGKFSFRGEPWLSHRAAYTAARGPIPPGMFVLHSCDNRRCCNPAHLRVGTHAENIQDAVDRGRNVFGERVVGSKLTEAAVLEIRSSAVSQQALARRFGVAQSTVSKASNRINWRSVP